MRLVIIFGLALSLVGIGCSDTDSADDDTASGSTSVGTVNDGGRPGLTATVADQTSSTTTPAASTSSVATPPTTATTGAPSTTVEPEPALEPPPDPLAGRSLAEICSEYGLELIAFPFDTLQGDYADTCCVDDGLDPDSLDCQLDWPFSDVPDCSSYDDMRNAVYARYGFPFQTAEYRQRFGEFDWYVERADFDASWLTPIAQANVAKLQQLRADEVGCLDYDETDDGE